MQTQNAGLTMKIRDVQPSRPRLKHLGRFNFTIAQIVEMRLYMPRFNGFTADTCGGCGKTVNRLASEFGWFCRCGYANPGHLGGFSAPHSKPDFGPSAKIIRRAYARADRMSGKLGKTEASPVAEVIIPETLAIITPLTFPNENPVPATVPSAPAMMETPVKVKKPRKTALAFPAVRKSIPVIHAFCSGDRAYLPPTLKDYDFENQLDDLQIEGKGTVKDPYRLPDRSWHFSPHFAIVFFWYRLRGRKRKSPIVIKVSKWTFTLTPEGVIAEDGVFTRLLPREAE